jgi:hypothetical protein
MGAAFPGRHQRFDIAGHVHTAPCYNSGSRAIERHGSERALIGIESLILLEGKLSPRALGLVMEWASSHQAELMEDWNLARGQAPLKPIEPLR